MAQKNCSNDQLTPSIEGFNNISIFNNLNRLCNQIYKLLPIMEEHKDYIKPLETIIIELAGLSSLFDKENEMLLSLVCKLKGLYVERDNINFSLYRRTIFECCNLINKIKDSISSL